MKNFKIIIGAVLIIIFSSFISNKIEGEFDKVKTKVGQKLILQNDTLMIIDYSVFNSNYTLEDGRKISFDLANKLEWVDKNKTTTNAN